MNYHVVTSFSHEGYEQYGRKFIEGYLKHWKVPLTVYWEGQDFPVHAGVNWVDLHKDIEHQQFITRNPDKSSKDYRKEAIKFCHKVFAITDPERIKANPETIWIWLDADTETFADVDEAFLDMVCPDGFSGSYLGRCDWDHSECGFVSYRDKRTLEDLREAYVTDALFDMDQWHDSYVFDQVKKGWWFNISEGVKGRDVWEHTLLGTRIRHNKGNLKQGHVKKGDSIASMGGSGLVVKTKNSVKNENVQANVHYNLTLINNWIPKCKPAFDSVAIIASAGPSLGDHLDEIRELYQKPNHYLITVKHAHDMLIEEGLIPWACILLDPRNHVQDFIENPHPEVNYFVASQCHPTTVDKLLDSKAKVWGYNAEVGAGEDQILISRKPGAFMLGGGCSTATRGVSVLYAMGFRKFELFGYDLCFFDEPDWTELDKKGEPKYIKVEVAGKTFFTDAEKCAQCQDVSKLMDSKLELDITMHGPGMAPHYFNSTKKVEPDFRDILGKVK